MLVLLLKGAYVLLRPARIDRFVASHALDEVVFVALCDAIVLLHKVGLSATHMHRKELGTYHPNLDPHWGIRPCRRGLQTPKLGRAIMSGSHLRDDDDVCLQFGKQAGEVTTPRIPLPHELFTAAELELENLQTSCVLNQDLEAAEEIWTVLETTSFPGERRFICWCCIL